MPTQDLLPKPSVRDLPIPSNSLAIEYLFAMRYMMNGEELRRGLSPHGIYAQRDRGSYLLRVKVPGGALTPRQLRGMADLTEKFAITRSHVTTRQDVELNYLTADDLPRVVDALAGLGLSGSESGGNTVRNVITCPLAGICPSEAFDVRPYGAQLEKRFRGLGITSVLPRKFKIALSGCESDCSRASIHDLGLVANSAGDTRQGPTFRALVGGGLGALPKLAETLSHSLPAPDLPVVADVLLRIFQLHGDFEHRNRARLKYLVKQAGIEQIRRWIAQECKDSVALNGNRAVDEPIGATGLRKHKQASFTSELGDPDDGFSTWFRANVVEQRQANLFAIFVPLPLGHLGPPQWQALVELYDRLPLGELRFTAYQSLVIPGVAPDQLEEIHKVLAAVDLVALGGTAGITVCPGSVVCRRGITASQALVCELERVLPQGWQAHPAFAATRINVSGCPNSCARPQMATIGLVGCAAHAKGKAYPAYRLYLGGGTIGGKTALGRLVANLPACHAPDAISRLFAMRDSAANGDETFAEFVRGVDYAAVFSALADHLSADEPDAGSYVDWGEHAPFSLQNFHEEN